MKIFKKIDDFLFKNGKWTVLSCFAIVLSAFVMVFFTKYPIINFIVIKHGWIGNALVIIPILFLGFWVNYHLYKAINNED